MAPTVLHQATPAGAEWRFSVMANEAACLVVSCYRIDGGGAYGGEIVFRWHEVAGEQAARLEVYDDGWKTLWASGLVEILASLSDISLIEMCERLRALGFTDRTSRDVRDDYGREAERGERAGR